MRDFKSIMKTIDFHITEMLYNGSMEMEESCQWFENVEIYIDDVLYKVNLWAYKYMTPNSRHVPASLVYETSIHYIGRYNNGKVVTIFDQHSILTSLN